MSLLKFKNYTGKFPARLLFSRIALSETFMTEDSFCSLSLNIRLKIFFYIFLKRLKIYKIQGKEVPLSFFKGYGQRLQENGFYTSLIEVKKTDKRKILDHKILLLKNGPFLKRFFQPIIFCNISLKKKKPLRNMSKGLDKFEKYYSGSLESVKQRQVVLQLLKARKFFNKIFLSRLFLFTAKGRKKYRNTFFYISRRRRKLNSLFCLFTVSMVKYKEVKTQRQKTLKRVAWKVKKQKKRIRVASMSLLRLQKLLSRVFYIPKHLEVNYKTLGFVYLGFTDFKTTNLRIPFWFNFRKLVTFLS